MALWSGRFEEGVSEFTQEFGASLPVDKAMYKQDIAGSMAHARMLADQGVISHEDAEAITAGLAQIERDIEEGNFVHRSGAHRAHRRCRCASAHRPLSKRSGHHRYASLCERALP